MRGQRLHRLRRHIAHGVFRQRHDRQGGIHAEVDRNRRRIDDVKTRVAPPSMCAVDGISNSTSLIELLGQPPIFLATLFAISFPTGM